MAGHPFSNYQKITARKSLRIGDFAVHESHLEVLVDVNQLGTEVDDFVRLAEHSLHLVHSLAELNCRRLWRGRLL